MGLLFASKIYAQNYSENKIMGNGGKFPASASVLALPFIPRQFRLGHQIVVNRLKNKRLDS